MNQEHTNQFFDLDPSLSNQDLLLLKQIVSQLEDLPQSEQQKVQRELTCLFGSDELITRNKDSLSINLTGLRLVDLKMDLTHQNINNLIDNAIFPENSRGRRAFNIMGLDPIGEAAGEVEYYGKSKKLDEIEGNITFDMVHSQKKGAPLEMSVVVCWVGQELVIRRIELKTIGEGNFEESLIAFQKMMADEIFTAIDAMASAIKPNKSEQNTEPVLSSYAKEFLGKKILECINQLTEEKESEKNAREKKRIDSIEKQKFEAAKYQKITEELQGFFIKELKENRPQITHELNDGIFPQQNSEKELIMFENFKKHLLGVLMTRPIFLEIFQSEDEKRKFLDYISQYVKHAQIGHNYTDNSTNRPSSYHQKIGRQGAASLTSFLGVSPEQPYLSCALVNPESPEVSKYGTGWTGNRCSIFSLEEFSAACIAFTGDVDQYSHRSENGAVDRAFFVSDALLLGAVHQYIHNHIDGSPSSRAPYYDEILFMRRVDFGNEPISSFEVKSP